MNNICIKILGVSLVLTVYGTGALAMSTPIDADVLRAFICNVQQQSGKQLFVDSFVEDNCTEQLSDYLYVVEIHYESNPYLDSLFNSDAGKWHICRSKTKNVSENIFALVPPKITSVDENSVQIKRGYYNLILNCHIDCSSISVRAGPLC